MREFGRENWVYWWLNVGSRPALAVTLTSSGGTLVHFTEGAPWSATTAGTRVLPKQGCKSSGRAGPSQISSHNGPAQLKSRAVTAWPGSAEIRAVTARPSPLEIWGRNGPARPRWNSSLTGPARLVKPKIYNPVAEKGQNRQSLSDRLYCTVQLLDW